MPYPLASVRGGRVFKGTAAASGPALVQQKVVTEADSSGFPGIAFDASIPSGRMVIACFSYLSTDSFDNPPFLDNVDGTMSLAVTSTVAGVTVDIWYKYTTATATRIDGAGVGGTRMSASASEWSGVSDAAPEDTSAGSSVGSATLAVVPATLDPTSGNNLVIGIGGYASATNTYSSGPTNSFTRLTQTGGASVFQEAAYLIRAGNHSAVTSDVTLSGSVAWASCAAGFGAP